jgi:hypothetical protein
MSESLKIALTAFGGICIFVFGQILSKFFIEPIYEQKKSIGQIAHFLLYYAGQISSPGKDDIDGIRTKASDQFRLLSCELEAKAYSIPLYCLWSYMGLIIKKEKIQECHADLIFISNSLFNGKSKENREARERIKKILKLDP